MVTASLASNKGGGPLSLVGRKMTDIAELATRHDQVTIMFTDITGWVGFVGFRVCRFQGL